MAQYSPDFLASLKHRYEKTDQPMIELAREFGIGVTTLQRVPEPPEPGGRSLDELREELATRIIAFVKSRQDFPDNRDNTDDTE